MRRQTTENQMTRPTVFWSVPFSTHTHQPTLCRCFFSFCGYFYTFQIHSGHMFGEEGKQWIPRLQGIKWLPTKHHCKCLESHIRGTNPVTMLPLCFMSFKSDSVHGGRREHIRGREQERRPSILRGRGSSCGHPCRLPLLCHASADGAQPGLRLRLAPTPHARCLVFCYYPIGDPSARKQHGAGLLHSLDVARGARRGHMCGRGLGLSEAFWGN